MPATPGSQRVAVTAGYVAARVPRLTPAVMWQEAAHDDSSVAWLLAHSLADRQREEEEAREAADLEPLEENVAVEELKLLEELDQPSHGRQDPPRPAPQLHLRVGLAKRAFLARKEAQKKEEEKEEEMEDEGG